MRLTRKTVYMVLVLFLSVFVYALDTLSDKACAIYALIVSGGLIWYTLKADKARLSYTTAIMLYTIATQFGLIIPYFLIGESTVSNYSAYTLRFLENGYLNNSIMLGVIGVLSMQIGVCLARSKKKLPAISKTGASAIYENVGILNKLYFAGAALLIIVIAYFAYMVVSGGMRLFGTYSEYRSSAQNSNIYSYILIVFYVGTLYLASAGTVKKHLLGWIIWIIPVLIFALNGNKGEFLYAFLAVLGMKGVEGKRTTWKQVAVLIFLVFLVIPVITSLRSIGIVGNLSNANLQLFDAATEMGMQVRTSVYTLQGIEDGTIQYLWGKSYWQPLYNILTPFFSHTQATASIRKMFGGYGYNQVIESFVNFGVLGVCGYFGILGYWLGRAESKVKDRLSLAYVGTITCVLINVTRNYFAFVPGQILIITVIYFFIRKMRV